MKKMLSGLTVASCLFFLMSGCEKNNPNPCSAKKPAVTSVEKTPLIIVTPTATGFCGTRWPCGLGTAPSLSKKNQITLVVNATTHASFPSLTYTFYKHTSTSGNDETYTPITGAQYTCNAVTSYFASNDLDNGVKILVFANDASGAGPGMSTNLIYNTLSGGITNYPSLTAPSAYFFCTMGNFKGESCQISG